MLVSNVSMTKAVPYSASSNSMNKNATPVSFQASMPLKMPGKGIVQFFKDLKIKDTVKKMFNIVKNSKVVQAPINFFKKIGNSIVNSKVVQAPINFVKNIFKKPAK